MQFPLNRSILGCGTENSVQAASQHRGPLTRCLIEVPPACAARLCCVLPPQVLHRRQPAASPPTAPGTGAPREHCEKCGGRVRQPRGHLTGCLWEVPPASACRGRRSLPRSGACRLRARHGVASEADCTQGALRKMRRQGAATPGASHRVSVGGAPSLCLPRPPHTAPLRRLPPAPPPCALVSSPEKVITVQCQNSCNLQYV
jgi:hypothetical protein